MLYVLYRGIIRISRIPRIILYNSSITYYMVLLGLL